MRMFVDLNELKEDQTIHADLCIIGAGAAGITVAREFINKPYTVYVLESGGFDIESETQTLKTGTIEGDIRVPDWMLQSASSPHNSYLEDSRLRVFGGSTQHWGGFCLPIPTTDFEARPWIPDSGWPIRREDLNPYYQRAASICQISVPELLSNNPTFIHDPIDWGLKNSVFETRFIHLSPPTQFGFVYRAELAQAKNIHLIQHANVTELLLTKNGKSIEQLHVRSLHGRHLKLKAKRIVLAAGGIENSRLLLASNSVHKHGVGNEHDQVGRYFMEHPEMSLGQFIFNKAASQLQSYTIHDSPLSSTPAEKDFGRQALGVLFPTPEIQRKRGILNFSAQLQFPLERDLIEQQEISDTISRMIGDSQFKNPTIGTFFIRAEQSPNPNNRVTLDHALDPFSKPKTKLIWQLYPDDLDILMKSLELLAIEFGRSGRGRVRLEGIERLGQSIPGGCHHMGGTRMHQDPKRGVVNEQCRVHGIDNLYVAGSSVFPTGSCVNPTLTIVALALRLSERLLSDLSSTT